MTKTLKFSAGFVACLTLTAWFSPLASATDLFDFTGAVTAANSLTQTGRLVRNGVPQDWANSEPFPGTNNAGVTFNYITLTLTPTQLAGGPFVQISVDDPLTNIFVSAYDNSYNPLSLQTNWLGDAGTSGNYFGTDPVSFQITVPTGDSLVLVVNTTAAAGLGETFRLRGEYFSDTMYTDPTAVPEPSGMALLGAGGALGLGAVIRRRRQRHAA